MREERIDTTIENRRVMFGSGERDYAVDTMRCISCLLVVTVHNANAVLNRMPLDDAGMVPDLWMTAAMFKSVSAAATNLFLMISGIFFLSPERNVTPTKLWSKNILKLAAAYVLWSIIYGLLRIYYLNPRPFSAQLLFDECLVQEVHLWYIPMMLGIYILVPILRLVTERAEKKHYHYLIGIMAGAMTLNMAVYYFGYIEHPAGAAITTIISFTPVSMISQFPFYCILGYYFYTYPPKLKSRIIIYVLGIIGVLGSFYVSYYVFKNTGISNPNDFYQKFNIGIFLKNNALFVAVITLFSRVRFKKVARVIISKLSAATLFIYLYHFVPFLSFLKEEWLFVDGLPTVKSLVVYIAIIYVGGFLISLFFLQLIPWVRMRNAVLDLVWPNRRIWNGGRKKSKKG